MLNDTTKRKINTLRDILVGVVPSPEAQVNQITNALIYKYMDDMDQQAKNYGGKPSFFVGEYEKYSWKNLMDPKRGGQDRMNLYSEALESMSINKNIPSLFRDIFKGAFLPYRNSETLNLFLSEIDGFSYDHSEELGNAFEYLLSIMGSQGDAGQFRTPRHIIEFIVKVIDPQKNETILDPACGTAGFLISAYKHILNSNHDKSGASLVRDERKALHSNFTGYDINPDMTKFSRVNMFLHNFPDPKIYDYDTLSSDERWNDHFDIILANPPFMSPKGGMVPHKKFSVQSKRSEVLFVDYIMNHLTKNGRAGIIVPEGIIFQSGTTYKQLRKNLVEDGLYAVVSLPAGVFQPYSGVKTSILLFDNNLRRKSNEILFIKIENDGFSLGAQRRPIDKNDLIKAEDILLSWRNGKKIENPIANWVKKEEIEKDGYYNLSAGRYVAAVDYSNAKWPMVELGEISEVRMGETLIKGYLTGKGRPIFSADTSDKPWMYSDRTKLSFGKKTIVIGARGTIGSVKLPQMDDFTCTQTTIAVTVNNDVCEKYIYYQLKNFNFSKIKEGVGIPMITVKAVSKIKIPLLPLEIQEQIVAELDGYQKIIDGAKQITQNWKPKIDIDREWGIKAISEVAKLEYGIGKSAKDSGEYRYVRITDIGENGELKNTDKKYVAKTKESEKYLLKKGDVLVARTGATFGKTMYFDQDEVSAFAGFLIRFNFDESKVNSKYFWCFAQSDNYWEQARSLMTGGGQPQFNANAVNKILLPLPPLEIQKEIVEKIEAERVLVESAKRLIEIYEQKIKNTISKIWE